MGHYHSEEEGINIHPNVEEVKQFNKYKKYYRDNPHFANDS